MLIVFAVAVAVILALTAAAKTIKPSVSYSMRATFREMPSTDESLQHWIENQPGVYRAYVTRRDGRVAIVFGMSRDLTGQPPFPNFEGNFERLGYRGLTEFVDHRD